jgi:pilus assembly protein Flp/PilA
MGMIFVRRHFDRYIIMEWEAMLRKFLKSQSGATAIEYGLIAAGIAVAIAVTVFALGSKMNAMYANINFAMP